MGAPATASLGFAMGIERLLLVLSNQKKEIGEDRPCDIYIAPMGEKAALKAASICATLRKAGFSAQTDICGRGLKAQMRYANKIGTKKSVVLGDNELETGIIHLKNMADGSEKEINLDALVEELKEGI